MQNANYAVQNGCTLTRARVLRFKHNDMADLERVLAGVAKEDLKSKCATFAHVAMLLSWAGAVAGAEAG